MLVHAKRTELDDRPIAALVVTGKELQLRATAGAARRLLTRHPVRAVPVLAGEAYAGALDLETLAGADDADPVEPLVRDFLPVATASTPAHDALRVLDKSGGRRLVVVAEDETTYVGIVCLRGDRESLCVDAARLGPRRAEARP